MSIPAPPKASAPSQSSERSHGLLRRGIASAQAGNKVQARFLIRQVVTQEPTNEIAWLWLARLVDATGELIECLRNAVAANPNNTQARDTLVAALIRGGAETVKASDPATARRLFQEAIVLNPASAAAWLWAAGVAEHPADAVRCLNRVLALDPANERAARGLAAYKQTYGRHVCPVCEALSPDAVAVCPVCRAVVRLNDLTAFDYRVECDEAVVAANLPRLEERATADPAAAFALGLAYLNLGRTSLGIKALKTATHLPGADADLREQVRKLVERKTGGPTSSVKSLSRTAVRALLTPLVLAVDDSPTVRKVVAATLTAAGYRVEAATDGSEVEDAIRRFGVPNLVILDLNMPTVDGFAACKLLRSREDTASVPVIFLTGKDGFFNKLRGQWAGASEYLTKPFDPQTLTDAVTRLVPLKTPSDTKRDALTKRG